jgi:hypothetical protein
MEVLVWFCGVDKLLAVVGEKCRVPELAVVMRSM